ncbi:hypothetical protein [Paenibacillus harenae]|uniref:hypothetical protein n=1 Tax=Paenibacillus harenae TaxID=306543 RepID=UPI0003F8BE73|nr:hypothetical protein [Paenibacillus harenae]
MTSSVRSIRGIERTAVYSPVQASGPFAHYPHRGGEPQLPPDDYRDLHRTYRQAAGSAAEWLQAAGQAQREMNELIGELSRKLREGIPADESLQKLADTLNRLESAYRMHAPALKPELWTAVVLALRHPASEALDLHRSKADGAWIFGAATAIPEQSRESGLSQENSRVQSWDLKQSQGLNSRLEQCQDHGLSSNLIKRLMLGADGMLNGLKLALTYGGQLKALDLVQPRFADTLPYTVYYGAMQSNRPLPYTGLILNRYV